MTLSVNRILFLVILQYTATMRKAEHIEQFCTAIWQWYVRNKRTLPWRDLAEPNMHVKAYKIWVSEVMLQQTQVPRVEYKWKEWLRTFTTIEQLANANNKQVVMAWQGMGYNSRALRLRDTAAHIVHAYGTQFPSAYADLVALKGIGPYTAAAIRNFAFELPTPCIDTNIHRILHRTFIGPENKYGEWCAKDKEVLVLAEQVLTVALSSNVITPYVQHFISAPTAEWHAALMDYGSLVCTKRNPKWGVSPLAMVGLSKAAYKVPKLEPKPKKRLEPGRIIAGTFTPNRIVRGRIVQYLREQRTAKHSEHIGQEVCLDWSAEHMQWLEGLLDALKKDELIVEHNCQYTLKE
jgi:A/G-specific adenine glycosylase